MTIKCLFSLLGACFFLLPSVICADTFPYILSPTLTIGGEEAAKGAGLTFITAMTVDGEGTIYVADAGLKKILVFSNNGSLIREISGQGEGPGEFCDSYGVVMLCDEKNDLFILDIINGRFSHFSKDGKYISSAKTPYTAMNYMGINRWKNRFIVSTLGDNTMFVLIDKQGKPYRAFAEVLPLSKTADKRFFVDVSPAQQLKRRIPSISVDEKTGEIFALDHMDYRILCYAGQAQTPMLIAEHNSTWYPRFKEHLYTGFKKKHLFRVYGALFHTKDYLFVNIPLEVEDDENTKLDVFSRKTGKHLTTLDMEGGLKFIDSSERFYFTYEDKLVRYELKRK